MKLDQKIATQITRSAAFPTNVGDRFLGALQIFPAGKIYENLESDEKVIMLIRRHWITRIPQVVKVLLLAVLPAIGWAVLFWAEPGGNAGAWAAVGTWFWYTFVFYYVLSRFVVWQSDVYILTNERLIDFDANPVSRKRVKDTALESIHEVIYGSGGGLLKGSLDYGDVVLRSINDETVMHNIPMPNKVALAIGEVIEEVRKQ
jgi:hypothetical protein